MDSRKPIADETEAVTGMGSMDELNEQALFNETPEQAASRIIREGAPFAATAIVTMAADDSISPTVRLNAAKYIIDRNLGPVGKDPEQSELEAFLSELQDVANDGRPKS
jgi:hypothetical protein